MKKDKKAILYHPTALNCEYGFRDLILNLGLLPPDELIVSDEEDGARYVASFGKINNMYVISIKKLKNDELPKIADFNTGSNETNLEVPEGMSLSYKNTFVYDDRRNVLAMVRLSSCPQMTVLRKCLETLARENLQNCSRAKVKCQLIFKKGLADRLRNANSITMAKIRAEDYYGDNIDETRLEAYKRFRVGENCTSTIEIKRKQQEDIRDIVSEVIADAIANGAPPDGINVQMNVDGEKIDFSNYYKQYPIRVQADELNAKYLDYEDLTLKLAQVISIFGAEDEDA